jgi:hypothetical protein
MAKQLALDLGINLDAGRVSGSNSISAEDVELRRLLYWSMYCDDKLAAAYTGRVCTLLVRPPHPTGSHTGAKKLYRISRDLLRGRPFQSWKSLHLKCQRKHEDRER